MKKDSLIYTIVFSFVITFVLVFILSVTDMSTREIVAKFRIINISKAYLDTVGIDSSSVDVESEFKKIFKIDEPTLEPITARVDGRDIIVSQFNGDGLWGTITGVIATSKNLNMIVGLKITSHSETPGLGGRIEEDWFQEQFRGEIVGEEGIKILQSGGEGDLDTENSILDGVTGATRTSQAMEKIVNNHIRTLRGDTPVELTEEEMIAKSYLEAVGIRLDDGKEIMDRFNMLFEGSNPDDSYVYGRVNNRDVLGTTFKEAGLWGDIFGLVVVDETEIVGMEIIYHSEQQGASIDTDEYQEEYVGVPLDRDVRLILEGDTADNRYTNLDGIVGATTTTKAMEDGLNDALDRIRKISGITSSQGPSNGVDEDTRIKYLYLKAAGVDNITMATARDIYDEVYDDNYDHNDIEGNLVRGEVEDREIIATTFKEAGLWGDILGIVVVDSNEILGLEIISHKEQRGRYVDQDDFKEQFRGVALGKDIAFYNADSNTIRLDGIAGATTTTQAVEKGVNGALERLRREVGDR